MSQIVVDISDIKVSQDPDAVIVTYALGSCIAVILHDPIHRVGGMIHYMLPLSKGFEAKAIDRPAMFGDTGIPLLFESMYKLGSKKPDLVVKVAGGGCINDHEGIFNIGQRNYTVLRKLFWKNSVSIAAEDVGGAKSRTAKLYVGSGLVTISSKGVEVEL